MTEDTDDKMAAVEARAKTAYAVFDTKRKALIRAHERARTHKTQLKTLAAMMRHHADFMNANLFLSGWVADSVTRFAQQVEYIAEDCDD